MKLFLSWSGPVSHKIATILRDWVPLVLQSVDPYVSSEDIDKGARWSTDIAKELEESRYGVICITHQNVKAPWINFEAGALSKTIDRSNVAPFLFNIKKSDVEGPLVQFQLTIYEKEDIRKLISSINNASDGQRLDKPKVDRIFEQWWPSLETSLEAILEECKKEADEPKTPVVATTDNEKILEELLELSRLQVKILSSPEDLLPPKYFKAISRNYLGGTSETHPAWKDVDSIYRQMRTAIRKIEQLGEEDKPVEPVPSEFIELLSLSKGLRGPFGVSIEEKSRFGRKVEFRK